MKKIFKFYSITLMIIICFSVSINTYASPKTNPIESSKDEPFFIKNTIIPKHLYVISEDSMSKEESSMVASLQGIISKKTPYQIYIIPSNEPDYKVWLKDLNRHHKVTYTNLNNPWSLLKKFKCHVDGYVLYSSLNPPSINNACSLASLNNSIIIEKSLESKIKEFGVSNLIGDCSGTNASWAFDNLWNSGLNHSTVIQQSPSKNTALRDYAIMSKSLVFYEDDIKSTVLREKIFNSMDKDSHCIGWGPDEHTNVEIASKCGVGVIAADWSYNLSVLSSFPSEPITQKKSPTCKDKVSDGCHYVTFIMSDGDNQQWFLGNNFSSSKWFGSKYRGNFDLGWSISPSLYYLAPTVFNQYYKAASCKPNKDYFVVPPSGITYMYPSQFPSSNIESFTKQLNGYMKNVDENYVVILDDNSFYKTDLWDKYTVHSNIDGLFYLNYSKHNDYNGEIIWSKEKPVVSCRDLLWNGLEDENQLIDSINKRVNIGYTNLNDPNSYTFVYVHVWSKTMESVQNVISKLNENPRVKVIAPDVFMNLIKTNIDSSK